MRRKSGPQVSTPEKLVRDIRRKTRRHWSAEEKIRIILEGLRGEYSIAELCRREGIAESQYYSWSNVARQASVAPPRGGVPGSRQTASGRRYGTGCHQRRSQEPA